MDKNNYLGYDPEPDEPGYLRRLRYLCWFLLGIAVASIPDAVQELIEMYYH